MNALFADAEGSPKGPLKFGQVPGAPPSTGRSTTPRRVLSSVVQFNDPNANIVQPRARTPRRR